MNDPQRNNNPINLDFAGQPNATAAGRFAHFDTPPHGWNAAHRQIDKDQSRGLTFGQFIGKFAPPRENNTSAYLLFVCDELHVTAEAQLSSVSKYAIAGVMAQYEGYYAT
jgi:hypothetical protein